MAIAVSSWFIDQLNSPSTEPVRTFTLGGSDYSDDITKWPRVKKSANEIRSVSVTIPLINIDGHLNGFYQNTYLIPSSATLEYGFTHPSSGDETIPIFSGFLNNVTYDEKTCQVHLRDKFWDFTHKIVGESSIPVSIGPEIPTDTIWTLCTCYGELSNITSTSNPDIDYASFLTLAAQYSADSVTIASHFDGQKVSQTVSAIMNHTDAKVWIEGDGKLNFKGFIEISSLDTTFTDDEISRLRIDVEKQRLINTQHIDFNYSVSSDYWQNRVTSVSSTSVNTFSSHEDILQNENVWYTTSSSALSVAQKRVFLLNQPPRRFTVSTELSGLNMQIADTIRLVDSFFNVTSASGWQITEYSLDSDTGDIEWELDEAVAGDAFYLDVSTLDGDHLLL